MKTVEQVIERTCKANAHAEKLADKRSQAKSFPSAPSRKALAPNIVVVAGKQELAKAKQFQALKKEEISVFEPGVLLYQKLKTETIGNVLLVSISQLKGNVFATLGKISELAAAARDWSGTVVLELPTRLFNQENAKLEVLFHNLGMEVVGKINPT